MAPLTVYRAALWQIDHGRMEYRTCTPIETADLCAALLDQNFRESGLRGFDFCLNREAYEALSIQGDSFGIVALDDGRPVGMVSVFVGPDPHITRAVALNDTIFVLPEYRPRGIGGQLFVRAEREAKARGAVVFFWQVGIGSPLDQALQRRCAPDQVSYARRL